MFYGNNFNCNNFKLILKNIKCFKITLSPSKKIKTPGPHKFWAICIYFPYNSMDPGR